MQSPSNFSDDYDDGDGMDDMYDSSLRVSEETITSGSLVDDMDDTSQPFGPADDDERDDALVPPDHPALDSNIDAQELYDEGVAGAAELPFGNV